MQINKHFSLLLVIIISNEKQIAIGKCELIYSISLKCFVKKNSIFQMKSNWSNELAWVLIKNWKSSITVI